MMRRSTIILTILTLRTVASWCPKRQCVPNNIMTLNYYGENTGCPDLASEHLEAVMSGVFTMPNGNRKQNEWSWFIQCFS